MPTLPTTANVVRPQAEGYHALLQTSSSAAGMYVQCAPSSDQPAARVTVNDESVIPSIRQTEQDYRQGVGLRFSRNAWSGGEGLDEAHRTNSAESDVSRFWDSKGIAVTVPRPGDQEQICLAKSLEEVAGATPTIRMVGVADHHRVFVGEATEVRYSDNIMADVPTWTVEDPEGVEVPGNLYDLTVDGRTVYAALGALGIHIRTWAGVWSHWSDVAATRVWCVKRRVIAAAGNTLYDAYAGADSVVLKALETNATWNDVIDAGLVILAAASDGKVYAFSDESGTLVLRGETPLRPGEVPSVLGFADGLVLLGVDEPCSNGTGHIGRLYIGQLAGMRLRGNQLIREWGTAAATVNHAPSCMYATRDEVLIGVLDDDGKLAVFSYLLATAGTVRRQWHNSTARPMQALSVDGRLVIARYNTTILREHATTYQASGWVMTPFADWFSVAQKSIVGLSLDFDVFTAAGAQIDVYYTTDPAALLNSASASWLLGFTVAPSGTQDDEVPLDGVEGRGLALMIKLTRSTAGTATPAVRAVAARALEQLGDIMVQLPVNVSDHHERPGKKALHVPGLGTVVYDALLSMEGGSVQVTILRTGEVIRGRLQSVAMPITVIPPRGAVGLVSTVTVRGVRV